MTSLSQHCDKILAAASPFRRYVVVGDAGTGKSALLQKVSQRCRDDGLLVLHIVAPRFDTAEEPGDANLDTCQTLISQFVESIDAFEKQRPGSMAATSAARDALGRARSPNIWHHLGVNATAKINVHDNRGTIIGNQIVLNGERVDWSMMLNIIQQKTEEALSGLAGEHTIVILVDDVHKLDGTSAQRWLRGLLTRLRTHRTVIFRRPGNDCWGQDRDDAEGTIRLLNMSPGEVRGYVRDQGLDFTDEDARGMFELTRGHPFAVWAWCDLALNCGAARFADLVDLVRGGVYDEDFTRLVEGVQVAVDQIAADVLGYQVPLFGLLTIAERVTPGLIAMLEGDARRKPSEAESHRIYRLLAQRQFVSFIDDMGEESVSLPRAISDVAWRRLRDRDRLGFRALHSCAERYERDRVDLDRELLPQEQDREPFAAWTRFEQPSWIRSVESWITHTQWLGPDEFQAMKPTLVKLYLDAFWWWDDYLRSKATRAIATSLKKVSARQEDKPWMDLLERFSDHWVSSWDEAERRADPEKWESVLGTVTALLGIFGLQCNHVPADMTLRRIYILLCNFYGKALWYAGTGTREDAEEADGWLAAAYRACQKQPGEEDRPNPNGWIGSWARLRQVEIWAGLDRARAIGYLAGLDQTAINDKDDDLRVGVAMLTADLWWRSGDYAKALEVYSRAALLSYAYNLEQEKKRQAPNLYTKSLYASTIRRAEEKISQAVQVGDPATLAEIDTALAAVRELFRPYWEKVCLRPDRPADPTRFELPVPPPWPGDILEIDSQYYLDQYYLDLNRVVGRLKSTIEEPIEPPPVDIASGRTSH
jgi:AAA ATPase domain